MAHAMMKDLVARGFDVRVVVRDGSTPYRFEGIEVGLAKPDATLGAHFQWCDIAFTHLDVTRAAMAWAKHGRPLVHVVHNHRQLEYHRVTPERAALVVWNSEWTAKMFEHWKGRTLIVHPPVRAIDYKTERWRADSVTLINMNEAKGGHLFWKLAERMPDVQFLGVRGSYGHQETNDLPNVEVWDNTPHARAIYERTRVLLVPSSYESWGRVAIEAIASGIPVLAHPTPGLTESLGDAGLFADREDLDDWERQLRRLLTQYPQGYYKERSIKALDRSSQLNPENDLAALAAALVDIVDPTERSLTAAPARSERWYKGQRAAVRNG